MALLPFAIAPGRSGPRGPALAGLAALLALAGAPGEARAASCCGGGGSSATVLPRQARWLFDLSGDWEGYDGFWDSQGTHRPDPAGSKLRQWRANLAVAARIAGPVQVGLTLPYVWNSNVYSGTSSFTHGLGDAMLALWYEALDERTAWRMRSLADLVPTVTLGPSLTVPTGISPYDEVESSFDVTGRGFYRVDLNAVVEKGYRNLSGTLSASYGFHLERPVNRLYGRYVEPYHRKLGNRAAVSFTLGYRYVLDTRGQGLTANAGYSWLDEANGAIDGAPDTTTAMTKNAVSLGLTYSSTDHGWSARVSWSHAIQSDGWGKNFPTTDIVTLGARYVLQ